MSANIAPATQADETVDPKDFFYSVDTFYKTITVSAPDATMFDIWVKEHDSVPTGLSAENGAIFKRVSTHIKTYTDTKARLDNALPDLSGAEKDAVAKATCEYMITPAGLWCKGKGWDGFSDLCSRGKLALAKIFFSDLPNNVALRNAEIKKLGLRRNSKAFEGLTAAEVDAILA